MFMIGALIIAIAASAISVKTLVGYTEMRSVYKILISLLIVSAWFAPVIVSVIRAAAWGNTRFFAYVSDVGYFLFGIVFLLLILLLLRDFLWFFAYETAKLIKSPYAAALNPSDVRMLNLANLYTVALTFLLGFYALYEGIKLPAVKEVTLASPALKREYTLVQLSDLHINRTIPPERIEKLVEKVNALEPDVILLTGDIGDDKVEAVGPQMAALEELQTLVVVHIAAGQDIFQPGRVDAPHMGLYPLDGISTVVGLGLGLLVLGGEHRHRRDILQAVVHEARQFLHALHRSGRDGHKGQALALHILAESFDLLLGGQVALVAHHDLGALCQLGAELCQLLVDLFKVLHRLTALAAGDIHHMQQQAAALHMAQEVMSQTDALAGTLDQAGDVGADKACALTHRHDTQGGHQRGEVIVRDLGLGRADGGDEGGLSHIGETDQTHIGDQLQLQRHLNVLAGHTGLCKLGDLAGGRGKMRIAVTAAAALCDGDRGVVGQVRNDKAALGILDDGAQRHLDDKVLRVFAVAQAGAALAALRGHILALIAEVHQGGQVIVHHKDDIAAAAAVAAVRTALRNELLAAEASGTIAAFAALNFDIGFVDEFHVEPRKKSG